MRHEILVPLLSETVDEGILVTWFVELGQRVRAGNPVAEVQVEKMASEVTAPAAGRVTELLAAQGDVVTQGALLAVVESEAETEVEAAAEAARGPAAEAAGGPASPAAKRLARELEVDLATVVGSGPGGRIVEADIRRAAHAEVAGPAVVDGATVPRRLAVLSLTFDHRVVDGRPAAAFLDTLRGLLEDPDRVLGTGS